MCEIKFTMDSEINVESTYVNVEPEDFIGHSKTEPRSSSKLTCKIGRTDPCPCNSGKKYKEGCLKA